MKITFVSNFINHHQIPFCNAMYAELGTNFTFIQTEPMSEERIRMGWSVDTEKYPYVRFFYKDAQECRELIRDCDLLLAGWMENTAPVMEDGLPGAFQTVMERLDSGRPAIRISERIYREGQWKAISPKGLLAKYREHIRFRKKPVYLLCAGAYVASDFALIGAYPGKKLRFGYFPELKKYENNKSPLKEKKSEIQLLWAGRFLPLKHPEFAVRLAADLREQGLAFHLTMIGSGELEEALRTQIAEKNLQSHVTMKSFLPPEEVREHMEKSHIYLFTSNYLEGWGAVVNEAMNSGCAVAASAQAGSVPFLIENGINGLTYPDNSYEKFRDAVLSLLRDPEKCAAVGQKAYETICEEWNAEVAANRCIEFAEGNRPLPQTGPFSPAPVLWPKGFRGENSRWE